MSARAGTAADLQATGIIEAYLSLPRCIENDDRESLFKHEFKSKVCFAQDWYEQEFVDVGFGNTVNMEMPKHFDVLRHQYLHLHLPGIIGVKGDTPHAYPYLVVPEFCQETGVLTNCVPVQERVFRDFNSDPELGQAFASQDELNALEDAVSAIQQESVANTVGKALVLQSLEDMEANNGDVGDLAIAVLNLNTINKNETLIEKRLEAAIAARDAALNQFQPSIGSLTMRPFAHWVQGVGYRVVEKLIYEVGQQVVDTLDYRYLHAIEELQGAAGKRHHQVGMHSSREDLIRASLYDQELFIPLPLWYTHFIGISNHVVMQQLTNVNFKVQIADLKSLIICSDILTTPFLSEDSGLEWKYQSSLVKPHDRRSSEKEVRKDSLRLFMLYNVYYLEEAERDVHLYRATHSHEKTADVQVITKVQSNSFESVGEKYTKWQIIGQESIFEIIVTAQLESNRVSNNWFNLSRIGPDLGSTGASTTIDGVSNIGDYPHEVRTNTADADIITKFEVLQNDQARFYDGPSQFWRGVVPRTCHTSVPDTYAGHYIYTISWAVFPEDVSTYSGSINITRISKLEVIVTYHPRAIKERKLVEFKIRTWGLYTMFSNVGGHSFAG